MALVILASLLGIVVMFFDLLGKSFLILVVDYKVGFTRLASVNNVDHLVDDEIPIFFSVTKMKWFVGSYRVIELSFSFPYFERKSHIILLINQI